MDLALKKELEQELEFYKVTILYHLPGWWTNVSYTYENRTFKNAVIDFLSLLDS